MIQNRVGSKSFLWHKQLNYDITAILQIWINTYVNPAELGKQKVFLHVLERKARTRFVYTTRHVVEIFARTLRQQRLIQRSYYVIKAYPKIVCHGLSRYA